MTLYNVVTAKNAGRTADAILTEMKNHRESIDDVFREANKSFYTNNPGMGMPVVEIDGVNYIGMLQIPALGLELPVAAECSSRNLKLSPCRYEGSAYEKNLIIAGHNYRSHFAKLKMLGQGDRLVFVDADGNGLVYEIVAVEDINGKNVEQMKSGQWDLTLFTCTTSGKSRFTVRAELI